jgi:2'-5' RNA ligase
MDDALRAPKGDEFHLTLQFLGDTNENDVPAIGRALEEVAERFAPIDVRYVGLGAFPEPSRARTVWAGVRDEPQGALGRLATAIGKALTPLGFPPEARVYRPHITLGRLRRRPDDALVEAVQTGAGGAPREATFGEETLSDLKLILSSPEKGRYHYIDLTTAELAAEVPDTEGPDEDPEA